MSITWDPANAAKHYNKHHISFAEAATAFTDPNAVEREDKLHPGRKVLIGLSSSLRLLRVSFEEEDDTITIISARKASPSNREEYSTSNHL